MQTRRAGVLALLASALTWLSAGDVHAEQPLALRAVLSSETLGKHLAVLEDRGRELGIRDVERPEIAARFRSSSSDVPSFGFTPSVFWLRFTVENRADRAFPWLLELADPLLDDVTLYVPRAGGGFDVRATGAMRLFRRRDVAYRYFVFRLEEPAQHTQAYYLRVASTSSITLPLVAWSLKGYLEHQQLDWFVLCIFYGVLLMVACYNGCVYALAKRRDYLAHVGYVSSAAAYYFTTAGHTFQFLLPEQPDLAQRLVPASSAVALLFGCVLVLSYLPTEQPLRGLMRFGVWYFLCLAVLSFVAPNAFMAETITASSFFVQAAGIIAAFALRRRGGNHWKLFSLGWGSAVAGALIVSAKQAGFLPHSLLITWAAQIGLCLQLVLFSSALADQLNAMRTQLSSVNAQFSQQVGALCTALAQTSEATLQAEQATRLKDEFMATMSHEFRSPLNPIINNAQGLLEEFVAVRHVVCAHCASRFELAAGEQVSVATSCPECHAEGGLGEHLFPKYLGDPAQARRALAKIERSGWQLLQVVNGILEFSKIDAGHVQLQRESFETAPLLREVVEEMRSGAEARGIELVCSCRLHGVLYADRGGLRQVLMHLVHNAIKFSAEPGRVRVSEQATGEGHMFSVSDQGIGIPREHWDRIFASFEQVSKGNTRHYGGTGIGLSIARAWVRMHGGLIWLESEPGRGSTFFFRIPNGRPERLPALENSA